MRRVGAGWRIDHSRFAGITHSRRRYPDFARPRAAHSSGPRLRWFIAARSRLSEEALTEAVNKGATQLVVLGAGFDTLAYRTPLVHRLRIRGRFSSHASTQARHAGRCRNFCAGYADLCRHWISRNRHWPTRCMPRALSPRSAASSVGSALCLISRRRRCFRRLATSHGWRAAVRWCSTMSTRQRRSHRPAAPRIRRSPSGSPRSAKAQSYFDTAGICARLSAIGFRHVDDIGPERLAARFFPERTAPVRGGHIMHASTI